MATKEGSPSLAGKYEALPMPSCPEAYYLGEDEADEGEAEDKTVLLDCVCGSSGCWPLLCKINVEGSVVTWTEFEQPFRSGSLAAIHWDYSSFKGFRFNKNQYLKAIEAAKSA